MLPTTRPFHYDDFCAQLVHEFDGAFPLEAFSPQARLVDDLGFDSVTIMELYVILEEWGCALGDSLEPPPVPTVADAFQLYLATYAPGAAS